MKVLVMLDLSEPKKLNRICLQECKIRIAAADICETIKRG